MTDEEQVKILEGWLADKRSEQTQLIAELRQIEADAEAVRLKITALDDQAEQIASMISSYMLKWKTTGNLANSRTRMTLDDLSPALDDKRSSYSDLASTPVIPLPGPPVSSVSYFDRGRNIPVKSNIQPLSRRFSDLTITQACTLLLRESAGPMHVNELYTSLVSGGMEFKGNNPTISIAVSLNRNKRFRKVGPGTFDLIIREASKAAS